MSKDTNEMFYSQKRQQFLVDQGYAFKVVTHLAGIEEADLHFKTTQEQKELLKLILLSTDSEVTKQDKLPELDELVDVKSTSMASLTGAVDMTYQEYNKPVKTKKRKR